MSKCACENLVKFSEEVLQSWRKRSTPVLRRNESGTYFTTSKRDNNATFFLVGHEKNLVACVASFLKQKAFMDRESVWNLAKMYHDEIVGAGNGYDLMVQAHFSRNWFKGFLPRHSEKLGCFVTRSVGQLRLQCFNCNYLAVFFAFVSFVYNQYNFQCRRKVYNLDETCFYPDRDLWRSKGKRVVTSVVVTAVCSRVNFLYTSRISILLCFNMFGESIAPAVLFKGIQEPRLRNGAHVERVSDSITSGWHVFWRGDVGSCDCFIFKTLVPIVRSSHLMHEGILFYDNCRSHLFSSFIYE